MKLDTSVENLPKIGPSLLKKLKRLKIRSVRDLIYHIPFRYENIGGAVKISDISMGEMKSATGAVLDSRNVRTKYGKMLTFATINDGTSSIQSVWFNQPFLTKTIKPGGNLSIAGKVDLFSGKLTFINPKYETFHSIPKAIHTQGIVSVYPETYGLTSKWIRAKINETLPKVLTKIPEILPEASLKRNSLTPIQKALWQIHFPKRKNEVIQARARLSFDEFLIAALKTMRRKSDWRRKQKGIKLSVPQEKILSLISDLPFQLTGSQQKVLKQILSDMDKASPMNRLLQGDVGSGKTVVAAISCYVAFLNGYKSALMAPTEILAIQHYNTIKAILAPLGVKIEILTGSRKPKEKKADIVIGTHALISKGVFFEKLALTIIDEQHRFGVQQRAVFRDKGLTPHVLTMTATPIPRSLHLTLYGDLDFSVIDEMPAGRKPVKTYLVPPRKRTLSYEFIRKHVKEGKQAFIIFPFIEPSETLTTVRAAVKEYEDLHKNIFPDLSLGLLHGRLKSKEKERIMESFLAKKTDILVATPVVEVGIDIPNATVMMIEAAERFGLASLHQLRGRVGRGSEQSYCLLFTESGTDSTLERLSALERYHNGLKLAEVDLKMRGPGQMWGTAQSGLPEFKIANIADTKLIEKTKKEADILFEMLEKGLLKSLEIELKRETLVAPN